VFVVAVDVNVSSCIPLPFHLLNRVEEKRFVVACSQITANQPGRIPSPTPPRPSSVQRPLQLPRRARARPSRGVFLQARPLASPHGRRVLRTQRAGSTQATIQSDSLALCVFWRPSFSWIPPSDPGRFAVSTLTPIFRAFRYLTWTQDGTAARTEGKGNFDPWLVCFCSSHRFLWPLCRRRHPH
jgi:hypothetical protein